MLKYHILGLRKPFLRLWVHISPATSPLLYLSNDALHTLHVLDSLLCNLIEALIEHEKLAKVLHIWLWTSHQEGVDGANLLDRDSSLLKEALVLFIGFLIECCDLLCDLNGPVLVCLGHKAPILKLNLLEDLFAGK